MASSSFKLKHFRNSRVLSQPRMPLLVVLILLDFRSRLRFTEKETDANVPWDEAEVGDGELVANEVFFIGEVRV